MCMKALFLITRRPIEPSSQVNERLNGRRWHPLKAGCTALSFCCICCHKISNEGQVSFVCAQRCSSAVCTFHVKLPLYEGPGGGRWDTERRTRPHLHLLPHTALNPSACGASSLHPVVACKPLCLFKKDSSPLKGLGT